MSTKPQLCDGEIVAGYCQRWSVEVAFADAEGQLSFHDARVWRKEWVEGAAPMAWLSGALVLLWYAGHGDEDRRAVRHRPWHPKRVTSFAEMLSCSRLALWENW